MNEAALLHAAAARKRGSQLIRYDEVGDAYDRFRKPIGIPVLAQMVLSGFRELNLPGDDHRPLLGASFCCGTGANEAALLAELESSDAAHRHFLHLFDGSDRMLAQARRKLDTLHVVAGAHQIDVIEDDYGLDGPLDWGMVIQAIHHLDHNDPAFTRMGMFFRRVRSNMNQGGSFVIVSSTPEQASLPRWYLNVLTGKVPQDKDPAYLYSREFPTREMVVRHLAAAGFRVAQAEPLSGPYIDAAAHNGDDPEILFDPIFRSAESVFQIAERFGLTGDFDRELRRLIRSRELSAHRARCEAIREEIGVAYAIRAVAI